MPKLDKKKGLGNYYAEDEKGLPSSLVDSIKWILIIVLSSLLFEYVTLLINQLNH